MEFLEALDLPSAAGGLVSGLVVAAFAWLLVLRRPSEQYRDEEGRAKLEELREEQAKQQARQEREQEQDQVRRDQLHDLDLIRRAIIAELEEAGGWIGFSFGPQKQLNERQGARAMYMLAEDGALKIQAKRWDNATYWVWEEDSVPVTPSNKEQAKTLLRQPDSVAAAYRRFRFERLLVAKHLDEELRCPEPDWSGG